MNTRLIIILISALYYFTSCRLQEAPTEPYQQGGNEIAAGYYPSVSPDGNKITYYRGDTIYIADTSGLNEKAMFKGRFNEKTIRWSPNGDKIGVMQADTVNWSNNKIISIDVVTKEIKILTPNISVVGNNWSWNNSNTAIACYTVNYSENKSYLTILSNDGNGTIIKKYSASEYCWAPDGNQIAYLSFKQNYYDSAYLYITSINSDTIQTFLQSDGGLSSLQWSPVNNIVAVNQMYRGLILYDVTTKSPVDSFYISSYFPNYPLYKFSPDGRQLIYLYYPYSSNPDAIINSYLYNIDIGSKEKKLIVTAYPGIGYFDWFPSSNKIVYEHQGKIYKANI